MSIDVTYIENENDNKIENESANESESETMLTTIDNPYNPFTQFTQWFLYDVEHGYNTCGKIARIAKILDDNSEKENDDAIEKAYDDLIKYDFLDIYKKVTPSSY